MTKRGEPLPINQALNRPRAKLGLDFSAWMAIVFVCVTAFLSGFRLLAMMALPSLTIAAWLIVRKHPKMFQLWSLSLSQKSVYCPKRTSPRALRRDRELIHKPHGKASARRRCEACDYFEL